MTRKEVLEMIRKTEEEIENNPELARNLDADFATMRMENPLFFERTENLNIEELSKSDFMEMLKIIHSHVDRNKMAN